MIIVVMVCVIYPLALWLVGQTFFSFQANGSIIKNADGKIIGSKLIAQPFTKDEFFQPRPSAASYDASASTSSALAGSNYALRARVASAVGTIVKNGNNQSIGADIEKWFQQDKFLNQSNIVAQWATAHNSLAQAWVNADPSHGAYVDSWMKTHPMIVQQYIKDNPGTQKPKSPDLAVVFFQSFSKENPGKFASAINTPQPTGKTITTIGPVNSGSDIQTLFFDMWRQDNPNVVLQNLPGDLVTTSASGLDPHISLQNAEFQLDRVATKWAANLKRNPVDIKNEIAQLLKINSTAPLAGLAGEKFINVLEFNLELIKRYGMPH